MTQATDISRRGLFTLGLARLRERAASELPELPSRPARPGVGDRSARMRAALDTADSGDLWLPVEERLLELAGPLPERARSLFGPMFSHDPRAAIDALLAAAGPGATVAVTAWTRSGVIGRLLRLADRLDPAPAGTAPPLAWAREERLRQDLERHGDEPRFWREHLALRFPSRAVAVERLITALPALLAVPDQQTLRAEAAAIIDELADDDGAVTLGSGYLVAVAVARKRERSYDAAATD